MKQIDRKQAIAFIFVVSTLLIFFYYVFQTLTGEERDFLPFFFINIIPCTLIASIDFLIVDAIYTYLKIRNIYLRVTVDLLVASLCSVGVLLLGNFILQLFATVEGDAEALKSAIFIVLWNSIVVLLIEILFYNRRQLEAERQMAAMEREKIQYHYEALKAQINPHFLFNSLNVLASLAYEDAEKANIFAKKMSGIYRYLLLTNERTTVTLKEELAFLESYLFLEQVRFENALFVTIHNPMDINKSLIPVSLQLLVENAIKHNITSSGQPLHIQIEISASDVTVSNNLQLRSTADSGGVGLKNLQKQYALQGRAIEIIPTRTHFAVIIPFIE
ncbi:sensor histidine kinase [Sphingobacterium tabacisoli]|uniref:Sensor histidine kinase n=1 Tax=Sphingobacterium tabacisoli TaxID=2044855 RepID=A0ABW5L5R8_9SPHI|nr:sensor histidine kinase [Sphingobacterium tabacisoli]